MSASEQLLLYCLIEADGRDLRRAIATIGPGGPGGPITKASIELLTAGSPPVDAVIAPIDRLPHDRASLLAYARVIARVHEVCTPIPMRYGNCFADRALLRTWLIEHAPRYQARLTELRGTTEIAVHLRPATETDPPATDVQTGTDYLRRRAQIHAEQASAQRGIPACLEQIKTRLSPWLIAHRSEPLRDGISLFGLIPRTALRDCRRGVQQVGVTATELHLSFSGPWPPYNFVIDDDRVPPSVPGDGR